MGITVTTDPIPVPIGETVINLKRDPSATPAWDRLMEIEITFTDPKKRDESFAELRDTLAEMADTPEDADKVRALDPERFGPATLRSIARQYAAEVTGFPTQPPQRSTKR